MEEKISLNSQDPSIPPASAGSTQDDRSSNALELSGLEALKITPQFGFAVIGERTNITGSPKFSKLILAVDFEAVTELDSCAIDDPPELGFTHGQWQL